MVQAEFAPEETAVDEVTGVRRIRAQYVVDDAGKRVAVILPVEEYEFLLDELEDYWDGLAIRAALAENAPGRPAEEVFAEIERERGWTTG